MRRILLLLTACALTASMGLSCSWHRYKKSVTAFEPAAMTEAEPVSAGKGAPVFRAPASPRAASPMAMNDEGKASALLKNRMVIYTGSITLNVANREEARAKVEALVEKSGGYIVSSSLDTITFRLKPEAFKSAMEELARLGSVMARDIQSEDVTDQYTDTKLRMEVAEGSRKRLMELLARAKDEKAVVEVERDIRRLTEEIERMKGQMRMLENQVALATLTVMLRELVPPPTPVPPRPPSSQFAWLNDIGVDKALEELSAAAPLKGGSLGGWLAWEMGGGAFRLGTADGELLPGGFLPLEYSGERLIGSSADGHRLRAFTVKTRQEGELAFWAKALEQELIKARGYMPVKPAAPATLTDGALKATRLVTRTSWQGNPMRYDLWLIQNPDDPKTLLVIDYAREETTSPSELARVEQAVSGVKF